jgi:hypothetical protein
MSNYPPCANSTENNNLPNSSYAPNATSKCQLYFYKEVADPISTLEIIWQFRNRLKSFSKRRLRYLRYYLRKLIGKDHQDINRNAASLQTHLIPGDRVRVKSQQEIQALLNPWQEQNGCAFMEEMWIYCGTEQVVKKRVEKFLDEATLRMHTSKGLILLEDLFCEGTIDFGRCDRSCYYFWREEWLEKLEDQE